MNATALATGVHPAESGPLGNYEFRPRFEAAEIARMDDIQTVRKGDAVSGGKYLAVATIAEIVQAAGGRTAVAGTKSAPLLFDRKAKEGAMDARTSVTLFEGKTLPESRERGDGARARPLSGHGRTAQRVAG